MNEQPSTDSAAETTESGTQLRQPYLLWSGPKSIVICSDGTGNTVVKGRGTNVYKLYEAVDLHGHVHDSTKWPQIAFYDDGVGTERLKLIRLLSGAVGIGLGRNVRQLYAHLVRSYNLGDRIYLFGFSRGAFTVRTLAGLIFRCGILDRHKFASDKELRKYVSAAYQAYRRTYNRRVANARDRVLRKGDLEDSLTTFRAERSLHDPQYAPNGKVRIHFVGVWDTVDAVGLPIKELADILNLVYRFKFPNTGLLKNIDRACHALSIDDERLTFHPLMWNEDEETEGRVEQVWFAGVHSNVGGGYPKHGMSLVTLDWMMTEAEKTRTENGNRIPGLRFIESTRESLHVHQNVHDKLYDSRSGLAAFYRYRPRDIGRICDDHNAPMRIHESVIERIRLATEGYCPGNIPSSLELVPTEFVGHRAAMKRESLRRIKSVISKNLNGVTSPLDRVKIWSGARRFARYGVLMTLLVLLIYALVPRAGSIVAADGLQGRVIEAAKITAGTAISPAGLAIIVIALVFFASGWLGRKFMRRFFSTFWYTVSDILMKDSGANDTEQKSRSP